jgi:hypothetical protein
MFSILIPEGAKWGTVIINEAIFDEEGNEVQEAVTRQKTIEEFCFQMGKSLDGTKGIVMLAAIEAPSYRQHGVTAEDLMEWKAFLAPYGITEDTWMNIHEMQERMASADYSNPEESP